MQDANGLEVHRNRVRHQFFVKLIAEDDDVFESFRQWEPIAVSVIPDPRFTEEVKPCGMDHFRRSVQNYETADSELISRGRTYETLTLAGAGVAAENLSLVDEARHLSGDSNKAITFPVCPMMDPSIFTPLRAEFGLAVYLAECAAVLRSLSDLTPEAL